MNKFKYCIILVLMLCLVGCTPSVGPGIEISPDDENAHYLVFEEDGVEILRLVVLEGETYADLYPYFPTLREEEGYVKFWQGDPKYDLSCVTNPLEVYNEENNIIVLRSFKKIIVS